MSELQTLIDQAWNDHADDAAGVALRLPQALALVGDEGELLALARLGHHVFGAHLGAWDDGLNLLSTLAAGPGFDAQGSSAKAMRCWQASLKLAAGRADQRRTMPVSEGLTVSAQAAASLALHDAARAGQLLAEAVALVESSALDNSDPALRALAASSNGMAVALEEKAARSEADSALMIRAAQTAKQFWLRAGTWLEVERAEYRLAMSWLAAGDAEHARQHARACLAVVEAQPDPPALELFFGHEALGRAESALGNGAAHGLSLAAAELAFACLSSDDQGWCRRSLEGLQGLQGLQNPSEGA